MGNRGVLALIVLIALGAVFWLFGGADLFRDLGDGGDRDGVEDGSAGLEGGAGEGGGAAGTPQAPPGDGGPVLFGRAPEQRKGIGGLLGRVMAFSSGKGVNAPRLVLTGTGYGGEAVSQRLTGTPDGRFELGDLAAGEGYALHITGGGHQRTLTSVSVTAEATRDLGTIWLGQRGALVGVVLGEQGQGLAGATVEVHRGGSLLDMLEHLPDLMEQMDQDPVPIAQAPSGKAGRFRLENIDPGPINVVVRAAGYRQKMTKAVMTGQGAAGGSVTIRLEPCRPLAGIVVDERERPVAGARVACMDQNDMDAAFYGRQFTTTDAAGHFQIASPPSAAKVTVIVAAEGYPTLFTQTAIREGGLRLVLLGGADVVLRVLEAGTERAIAGARLMAMFGNETNLGQDAASFTHGVTDEYGDALVAARPGKLQMLFFNHPERGSGMFAPAIPIGANSIIKGPEDPTVKAPRTTLVFHIDKGTTLTGRVTDPDGKPIAGARCRVIGTMGFGATSVTDADGRYVMRGQSALVQMVVVRAPGYVQDLPGRGAAAMPPQPDARGEIQYDVVMLPAATVTGRVVGPDGKPMAGARVKTRSSDENAMVLNVLGGGAEGVTNAAGRYVIDDVRPGEKVRVLARRAGYLDGKSAEFAVKTGQINDAALVSLKRGSKWTVHVTDPEGRALGKARVEVSVAAHESEKVDWDPMSQWRNFADLTTAADGTALLELLPSGHVTLTVTHADYAGVRKTQSVERPEGGEPTSEDVQVRLRPAYELRGRVVDEAGKPVAGASVSTAVPADAVEHSWIPTGSAETGSDGLFAIKGLPDEPMQLFATADGFKRTSLSVATPRAEAEIVLARVSADAQKRLKEIQKELMEIYQAFAAVKDDAERQALLKRMQALQAEQAKLQGSGGGRR